MRDNLSLNTADDAYGTGSAPGPRRGENLAVRAIIVPEDEEDGSIDGVGPMIEDAAERDERLRRQREKVEREALARRSQAVKLNLP
jgi:hypothetical protein